MERLLDKLLALGILARHRLISLSEVPDRGAVPFSPPKEVLLRDKTFDPESFLPSHPPELDHKDFSSLGLVTVDQAPQLILMAKIAVLHETLRQHPTWTTEQTEAWLNEETQETILFNLGSVPSSIVVKTNRWTPTCVECKRSLTPFLYSVVVPGGFHCPGCDLESLLVLEVARLAPVGFKNRAEAVNHYRSDLLDSWRHRDFRWWDEQKRNLTPTYCRWRDREISKLT